MSNIKRTPVPLPGSNPKSPFKANSAPSKLALSQEFVESSDDSTSEAPREKLKKKEKMKDKTKEKRKEKTQKSQPTTSIAVHRPKVNGASKKAEKVVPAPAPKKAVKEPMQETSSSSEEEESEDEEVTNSMNNTGDKADVEMKDSTSDSDSSSEESEEEGAPAAAPQATIHSKPQSHAVDFRPVQPYVPPKDFTLIPTPFPTTTPATSIFSNLGGKQIWHITAPASVFLSSIKELAIDKALTLNGTSYEFAAGDEDEQATRSVLIPQQQGFKAVPTRISKTLHLRQSVQLSGIVADPPQPTSKPQSFITSTAVRAPRPQIKGLKMNFFPSGSNNNERCILGDTDSEDEAPARTRPATVVSELANGKRKHKEKATPREERAGSATKKSKKHRTPEEMQAREAKKARKEKKKEHAKS